MFGLFKSKSPLEKLQEEYQKLHEKAFKLSKTDRKSADLIYAEAEELMKKIESMNNA